MSEISIIQNFVCNSKKRFEMIEDNIPNMARIFNPCPIIVNYDTDNYDIEIYSLYKKHFENLTFNIGDNEDWATTTYKLLSYTDSPYICYVCEDIIFDPTFTKQQFNGVFEEYKKHNCSHLHMGRVQKYLTYTSDWLKVMNKGNYIYFGHCSKVKYKTLSLDGLFKRDLFESALKHTIGKGNGIIGMDAFEYRIKIRLQNIICAIPVDYWFTECNGRCAILERMHSQNTPGYKNKWRPHWNSKLKSKPHPEAIEERASDIIL